MTSSATHDMHLQSRIDGIDAMRFVAMAFIIFIHAPHIGLLGEMMDLLARFAVPFFFVMAGYFLRQRVERSTVSLRKTFIRLGLPFLFWISVYIAFYPEILHRIYNPKTVVSIMINGGPGFHLWFLSSMLVSTLCLLTLLKFLSLRLVIMMAVPLYIVGLAFGPYYEAALGNEFFWNTRNGPFLGLPLMVLGYVLAQYRVSLTIWSSLGILAFGLIAVAIEWSLLAQIEPGVGRDVLIGTVPAGAGAFLLALAIRPSPVVSRLAILGRYSLGIFAVHLILLQGLEKVWRIDTFGEEVLLVAATLILSTVFSVLVARIAFLRPLVR